LFIGCRQELHHGEERHRSAGKFETFKAPTAALLPPSRRERREGPKSQAYTRSRTPPRASSRSERRCQQNYKVLKASNGSTTSTPSPPTAIIGTSETYSTKSNATKGRDAVKALVIKELRIEAAKTGGAKFSTFVGNDGDTYFNLRAANGEIVLQSEGYEDKSGALGGIESVRENGRVAEQFEIIETADQAFFHLLAGNGEIIAVSEVYASVDNAERAVDSIVALVESEKIADPK
jgi:hypothetical protein